MCTVEVLEYDGLKNCIKISNGKIELIKRWELYKDIACPENEEDVDKILLSFGGTNEKN